MRPKYTFGLVVNAQTRKTNAFLAVATAAAAAASAVHIVDAAAAAAYQWVYFEPLMG